MYLQITTRCSMACEHCCYSCNTTSGEHMSMQTFRQCLPLIAGDEALCIGGGEPTLHPNFREILIECIAASPEQVAVITNGSVKKNALLLAKLAKREVIYAQLSTDYFHDASLVDREVYAAFEALPDGLRHGSDYYVYGQGSAVVNGLAEPGTCSDGRKSSYFQCACEGAHIRPNGNITWCGCEDAPVIGHVSKGWPEIGLPGGCWHNAEEEGYGEDLATILNERKAA